MKRFINIHLRQIDWFHCIDVTKCLLFENWQSDSDVTLLQEIRGSLDRDGICKWKEKCSNKISECWSLLQGNV